MRVWLARIRLDHIITLNEVQVDQSKIQAMFNWPSPATVTELREFLRLTSYYRKFVKDYRLIVRQLTQLLKKWQFEWNNNAEKAFKSLKQAMTSNPTLPLPNFSESFTVETDV